MYLDAAVSTPKIQTGYKLANSKTNPFLNNPLDLWKGRISHDSTVVDF